MKGFIGTCRAGRAWPEGMLGKEERESGCQSRTERGRSIARPQARPFGLRLRGCQAALRALNGRSARHCVAQHHLAAPETQRDLLGMYQ